MNIAKANSPDFALELRASQASTTVSSLIAGSFSLNPSSCTKRWCFAARKVSVISGYMRVPTMLLGVINIYMYIFCANLKYVYIYICQT